jgi:uncharacterized protein YjiS (DUF1127 family)
MLTLTLAHTERARADRPLPILSAWSARIRRRRELRVLLNAPDYLLRDIGVDRHALMLEVAKPFWVA